VIACLECVIDAMSECLLTFVHTSPFHVLCTAYRGLDLVTCRRPGTTTSNTACPFVAQLLQPTVAVAASSSSTSSRHTKTKSRATSANGSTAAFTATTASAKAEAVANAVRVVQYLLDHHAHVDVLDK
jgi:hypothetical protein